VSIDRVGKITGKSIRLYKADVRDRATMERVFTDNAIDCVIHFAGLKAVGESCVKPLEYYDNNLYGTLRAPRDHAPRGLQEIRVLFFRHGLRHSRTPSVGRDLPHGRTTTYAPQVLRRSCYNDLVGTSEPRYWTSCSCVLQPVARTQR